MLKVLFSLIFILSAHTLWADKNLEQAQSYYLWGQYEAALPYFQSAAKEGYGEACYYLGIMYEKGLGTATNYEIARRMYQRAIEYGYGKGEAELGDLYFYGLGTTQDYKKAYEIYVKGEQRGVPETTCRIAMFYYYNNLVHAVGLEFNEKEAFHLIASKFDEATQCDDSNVLYLAAKYCLSQNMVESACELLYYAGTGRTCYEAVKLMVKNDMISTFKCFKTNSRVYIWKIISKAIADSNISDAERAELFWIYANEILDSKLDNCVNFRANYGYSVADAMENAAYYGYPPAQKTIGDWYATGQYVPINKLKAREWYAKAKANGVTVPDI